MSKNKWIAPVAIVSGILLLIILTLTGSYNGLVDRELTVDQSVADLDVQLQRRFDLIPNLVKSVEGALEQEREIIGKVTEARTRYAGAGSGNDRVAADAELAAESYVDLLAMVVNVYAVPAVKPVIVHDPDAPVTVHVAPPGAAVTTYDVGVRPPVGVVTVIVALSSPATTVGVPGRLTPVTLFVTESGPKDAASSPVQL